MVAIEEMRSLTNPLFNANKMKLGIFGGNVSNGCAVTTAPDALKTSWQNSRFIARLADEAGLEALVPVARWKGFGGPSNFNGTCFETYTWAAGLAEATEHTAVFSTSHVPTVHPIMAAKQGTTIDHISDGRFALNIVCGWFQPELEMFGAPIMEHDIRYEYAQEWLDVLKLLWTAEDEFDFEGRFFKITKGFHQPKPIQQPFPAIMNAGGSPVGQRWAAKNADMGFVLLQQHDYDGAKRQVDHLKGLARDDFGRDIGVWASAYVVCRPTEKEARDFLNWYVVELGDDIAVDNIARVLGLQSGVVPPEIMEPFKFHFKAGWGGYPLVGTAEQITDELDTLAKAGIDGMLLSWLNYQEEGPAFMTEVLPLLEQAGLRAPAGKAAMLT
jgi:alkanesulfonate monooxygenase SsuD/methylene tetrahydromethanopterin reductase-like flavin-dependent oxidoreductase (luciferase family)